MANNELNICTLLEGNLMKKGYVAGIYFLANVIFAKYRELKKTVFDPTSL